MKKLILVSMAALLAVSSYGQSPFEKKVSETKAKMTSNYNANRSNLQKQKDSYEDSQEKLKERYEAYCKRIMGLWGDKEMVESTQKDWVEYNDNDESRSIVDFEHGDVTVEVLVDEGTSEDVINEKLQLAVGNLLESKGTAPVYEVETEAARQETVYESPILENQLDLAAYSNSTQTEKIAEAIVEKKDKDVKTVETESGQKQVVSIRMQLVEDHIPKRAESFRQYITKHSSTHNIDEPLVYAVIEQESSFNPMAKSSAGAYGLMQIVPVSGGRDANVYVNNRDVTPKPQELYDPDFNIQLGVGYLKKQMKVYFKGVRDIRSSMLCAIAAYNTGQGNVYYALTGKRSSSGVADFVNSLSYDQLYEYLKVHLPHAETRDYIQKVTSKMAKYTE